jgi:hypothetical protein
MDAKKLKIDIQAIEDMKNNHVLDEDLYCKCMVEMAYNLFREGDVDGCLHAINKCNPSYFNDKQLVHMQEDIVYKNIVIYLACKFIQIGLVETDVHPTQKKSYGVM